MFRHLKYDIFSGIAIFLISLPLSMGVALASGAPLLSGFITGIVGGLIVAPLSGSALGISGASAGLVVVILTTIEQLGFTAFLLAVMIAGLLQIIMGFARTGTIAHYFPSSVIKGMISGIGLIIFIKQIPHAIGYDDDYEGDLSFFRSEGYSVSFKEGEYSLISELSHFMDYCSPTAIVITLSSIIILLYWQSLAKKIHFFRVLHGSLIIIPLGIFMNQFLLAFYPTLSLEREHLVNIPVTETTLELLQSMHNPDFLQFNNPAVLTSALTLAFFCSLESLVSIEIVDRLDPHRRVTPPNRELIAQGIGNFISGLLGGLPMAQVVVRSSINIQAGAQSKASAFFSGLFLLTAVITLPEFLNKIPLASLASILLVLSYKLAHPRVFKKMYKAGRYHFVPFCATIVVLLLTNLFIAIVVGVACALIAILLESFKAAVDFKELQTDEKIIFRLSENVSFLNKANLKNKLNNLPRNAEVVIDATRSRYLDYDVFQIIRDFRKEAAMKHIKLTLKNVRGFGVLEPVQNVRAFTLENQQALTPTEVLEILKQGNSNFVNNLKSNRDLLEQVNDTQQGQFPIAIILSCMDSRTSVELVFDQGLGDVFSARVAGNVVNDDILGSMEYACKVAGSKLIVVLGHTHCGAIKGACAQVKLSHLTGLLDKIQPAVEAVCHENNLEQIGQNTYLIEKVAELNVHLVVQQIKQRSVVLSELLQNGKIGIVGGMYDIETGKVEFYTHL
jgi:MFS superfamily sulfate permease-like transporter